MAPNAGPWCNNLSLGAPKVVTNNTGSVGGYEEDFGMNPYVVIVQPLSGLHSK